MAGKPTLVSLARELGVSRQTISNALNAPHRVNVRTLERVLPAIEESGYRPHVAGRQLRTRRSRNLAMRLFASADGINGAILDRFLHALTEAAQRDGYRLTLFTAPDDEGEVAAIDELLSTADIDGFVLTSTHHDDARTAWLLEHDVPFVAFGRPWSSEDPFEAPHPWVDVDGGSGTSDATVHLLERGHRRIGFLGWPAGSGVGDDRRGGWQRALDAAGVDPATDELSLGVEDSVAEGARGARDLFARGATALVCASDSLAIGAVAAWRQGTPDASAEVPVIGFDDTPVAAALGLSSVRQPIEQVAEQTVTLLLKRFTGGAGGTAAPEHVLLPASLVLRTPDPHLLGLPPPGPGHPRP
ncbi:substrate-binding domain-containing protein [Nocardioides sp. WL0053]|uniref:Substrate-binding domain-containing protein n=1 Tax=Nocardioides jiangsuensis TaxID=2866161 RepID=A0ABS7RQW6_9ACTN|nr:substrate-binding domain-containing protein [Nocardioides jiangsuensis]MBY9075982.1 substrate-binding domain-containing protein [Nocardioides jiangsuensis]